MRVFWRLVCGRDAKADAAETSEGGERELARKRGDHGSVGAWERDEPNDAIEQAFRRLYATYEWLRDGASPFDAMTACRLQSPNWWRTARAASAAAWALLDEAAEPAVSVAAALPLEDSGGNRVRRVAAAIRWAIEAAVALRLPYTALQAAEAWESGWRGTGRNAAETGEGSDGVVTSCRTVFIAAGAVCRRDGCSPAQLATALDHAERALGVCYTERRSHR